MATTRQSSTPTPLTSMMVHPDLLIDGQGTETPWSQSDEHALSRQATVTALNSSSRSLIPRFVGPSSGTPERTRTPESRPSPNVAISAQDLALHPMLTIVLTPHQPVAAGSSVAQAPTRRVLTDGITLKLGRRVRNRDQQTANAQSTISAGTSSAANVASGVSFPFTSKPAMTAAGVPLNNPASRKGSDCVFFNSKVVSRCHAELWTRDGEVYLKDTASSSGTFLNRLRLSPSGKESRPYLVRSGDLIQLGIDYVGTPQKEDVVRETYKAPMLQIKIVQDTSRPPTKSKPLLRHLFQEALGALLTLANPYSSNRNAKCACVRSNPQHPAPDPPQCVICLSGMGPYQALFLAPCSHAYHFKCVKSILYQGHMFSCPLCRQAANLDASVSMDSLCDLANGIDSEDNEGEKPSLDIALAHDDIMDYSSSPTVQDIHDTSGAREALEGLSLESSAKPQIHTLSRSQSTS
ncbi:uncharacterized protein EV422DRAFT_522658 [Fimicolochytrium jonesii]|uniref:uncharacterized protein n=1 Tax=Fimicolochytrium jonesii TaxID=1396493 RepID=UPI0022FE3A64|nr:uncharacterized protein EV422DRAFT_522658 [Fimicolochytrium jonesii]KAI8822914.1 hypothetical protein EV422DRAFT_522658 [Fimicolochytrium jonesii]